MSVDEPVMRTDLSSGARAMARGAAINLGGTLVAFALAFLFRFVVTHVVAPADFGRLSLGLTIVLFAQVPTLLGLDTGVLRFVARGAAVHDERAARAAVQVAIGIVAVTSLAVTAFLWLDASWVATHFFHRPGHDRAAGHADEVSELLRIVALSLPAMAVGRVVMQAVNGFGVMGYGAAMNSLRIVVNLGLALPLLAVGLDVTGLAWASVGTAVLTCAVAFVFLVRVHPRVLVPAPRAWQPLTMLRFSLPQTLTGLMFFAILWTDSLMLGHYATPADFAVYTIVGSLLNPAMFVSTAVGQMFAPRIAAEDARGDRETLSRMLKRVTYWNTAASIPIFVALMVVAGPVLALFGPTYRHGAEALAILAAGQLLNTAAGPLGQLINLSGRPYITMVNNSLVAVLNVGTCYLLIPRYGLAGAAISTASALTLVNLIKLVQVRAIFGMWPFRVDSLRAFAAAGLAAGVAAACAYLPPWPNVFLQTAASGSLLAAAYGFFVWGLGMNEEDRELFAAARARLGRRLRRQARRPVVTAATPATTPTLEVRKP